MVHTSQGSIIYGPGIRVSVLVDPEIIKYYRSLIPKYYQVQPQKYPGHITVVRIGVELPPQMQFWNKHAGRIINFDYSPEVQQDGVYWYLNAWSPEIGDIREELGLARFRFADRACYHISLGNTKNVDYER